MTGRYFSCLFQLFGGIDLALGGEFAVLDLKITKLDLFELGLTGGSDSTARRDDLAVSLGLPRGMTPNALLAALNVLMSREEFVDLYKK